MSGTSIDYAKNNQFVYYSTLAFYNFGGSFLIEPIRGIYSGINLFQLYSGSGRYPELKAALAKDTSEHATAAKNWVNYKSVDEMKKLLWIQVARAVSGIIFVFFAPLLWTLHDLIYQRDDKSPYSAPFTHNFMGYDEIMQAKAWMECTSAYMNEHMKPVAPPVAAAPAGPATNVSATPALPPPTNPELTQNQPIGNT